MDHWVSLQKTERFGRCLLALALGLFVALHGRALGEPPVPKAGPEKAVDEPDAPPPPLDDRYRPHIAATEVVGIGDPVTIVAMVQRGLQTGVWMGKPPTGPLIAPVMGL